MAGISTWVGGVAAAVITPVLMGWLSRGNRPGRSQGDFKVVEYGAGYRALGILGALFFLALSGLAWRFPGKTDPANLKWAIAVFLFFALLSLILCVLVGRASLFWNQQEVRGPNALGKRSAMGWHDIISVDYLAWAQAIRLKNAAGSAIWAYTMMNGFDEFFAHLRQHAEPRGLMPFLQVEQHED